MPNTKPLVSIVLPVFNGEKTLAATLNSLLAQSYTNFELLIGIDGTKDGSTTIAQSYNDPRIKIIENPTNLGLANNLNKLISLALLGSEFIAMAEQDDVYVPERLQWQVEVMQQHPKVGLVSGIAEFVSDNNIDLFPGLLAGGQQFVQQEALFLFLYQYQLKVVNTCMLFRKNVHQDNGLVFKNTYGNFNSDWDYVLRFALVSQVFGIPKVLVSMNRTSQSTSVTTNKWGQFKASRQLLKDFKQEFPNLITNSIYKNALKVERKIELGYRNKLGIILYGIWYTVIYFDSYFFNYIIERLNKHFN